MSVHTQLEATYINSLRTLKFDYIDAPTSNTHNILILNQIGKFGFKLKPESLISNSKILIKKFFRFKSYGQTNEQMLFFSIIFIAILSTFEL